MSVTFLVTVDVPYNDPQAKAEMAEEMHDDLDSAWDIISVTPWASHNGAAPTPISPQQSAE